MTEAKKKNVAKVLREFYFYSELTRGENVIRIGIWFVSGLVGIVAPLCKQTDLTSIMGAYQTD